MARHKAMSLCGFVLGVAGNHPQCAMPAPRPLDLPLAKLRMKMDFIKKNEKTRKEVDDGKQLSNNSVYVCPSTIN